MMNNSTITLMLGLPLIPAYYAYKYTVDDNISFRFRNATLVWTLLYFALYLLLK